MPPHANPQIQDHRQMGAAEQGLVAVQISIQPIAHIVGTAAQSIGDTFIDINAKTGEVTVGGSGSGGGGAAAAASG